MKTKVLLLTTLLTMSMGAFAQSSPSSSTPSTQDSGPAVINVDKEELMEVILGRIHRVYGGVQALKDVMIENGATTFRDIYMVEGSIINDNDLYGESQDSHGIGYHLLPYELTLTRDGHFSGKVAVYGGKHLNNRKNSAPAAKVINEFRVLQFEWNTDSDNINRYHVSIASMDIRLGLFKSNGSWVALNLGAGFGVTHTRLPEGLSSNGSEYYKNQTDLSVDGRAGIEFHIALGKAYSLHGLTYYQLRSMLKDNSTLTRSLGHQSGLTNQVELNYHFESGHRGYKSSAGIFLQSQHMQRDVMKRGPEELDVGSRDRDFSGNTYTGGFQIKW